MYTTPTRHYSSVDLAYLQGYSANCGGHNGALLLQSEARLSIRKHASLLPSDPVGTLTATHEKVPTHRRLLRCLVVL